MRIGLYGFASLGIHVLGVFDNAWGVYGDLPTIGPRTVNDVSPS